MQNKLRSRGARRFSSLLLMGALLLGTSACASKARYTPAQAARERVQFLRQHGTALTPEQVHQVQQLPYTNQSELETGMQRILVGEEVPKASPRESGRQRLLDLLQQQGKTSSPKKKSGED